MSRVHEFGLKIRYIGEDPSEGRIDLYDGTVSLQGISQALQIATHAYLTNEVVSRATALKGATFYVKAPRPGSVVFDIIAILEKYPATVTIAAPVFYDFIKYSFSKACGYIKSVPETPYVSKLNTKDEPFFDALAETIEGPLQRAHRPIGQGVSGIKVERPRAELVTFNKDT